MDTKTLMNIKMLRNPVYRLGVRVVFSILALLCAVPAQAHEYYADGFTVVHPWGEATGPQRRDAPIYLILESITKNDRLLSAYSTLADRVELRGGLDTNAPALPSIEVVAGADMAFKPDQYHLLLKGLKAPLEWGRSYAMGLKFERAGVINVMISVGAH